MGIFNETSLFGKDREEEDLETAWNNLRANNLSIRKVTAERDKAGVDFSRPSLLEAPTQGTTDYFTRNRANPASISSLVDIDEPGFFEQAVAAPGRFARQLARGVVVGSAELLELPELMVNAVAGAAGMDERDQFRLLHNLSKHMKDSVGGEQAPEFWADKVAYYIGYMIPDMAGILLGGGIGTGVAKGVLKASARRSGKLLVRDALITKAGRMTGVIGYGTIKGGAFGGLEGAEHGAKQFTAMEAAGAIFAGFSKPVQVVANAAFMSGMAATQYDMNSPDWSDEIIASGILGGAFGLLGPSHKVRLAGDANAGAKTKAWAVKQRLQGDRVGLNTYMSEFLSLEMESLSSTFPGKNPFDFKAKLKERFEQNTGTKAAKNDGDFSTQLAEFFATDGTATPAEAKAFTEGLVRSADIMAKPRNYLEDPLIGDFLIAHGEKLYVERSAGPVLIEGRKGEQVRYVNAQGVERLVSPKAAEHLKSWEVEQGLREKKALSLGKQYLAEEKGLRGIFNKAHNMLVNPEGKYYWELEKGSREGLRTTQEISYLTYGASSWINNRLEKIWRRTGIDKIGPEDRTMLNEILESGKWADLHEKRELAGRKPLNVGQSKEKAQAVLENHWATIEEKGGTQGRERFEQMVGAIDGEWKSTLERAHAEGLLSDSQLEIFSQRKYVAAKTFAQMEKKLKLKDDALYKESLSTEALAKHIKGFDPELLVNDSLFLFQHQVRQWEYAIAKNRALTAWAETASSHDVGTAFAKYPEYNYFLKDKPGKVLTDKEVAKYKEQIANVDLAHANRKAQVNKKLVARDKLTELELDAAYRLEQEGIAPEGSYVKLETELAQGTKSKGRSVDTVEKNIAKLEQAVEKEIDKSIRLEDWAQGDFDRFKVEGPRKATGGEEQLSAQQRKLEGVESKLRDQLATLQDENRKPVLIQEVKPEAGFTPIEYMEVGKQKTLMIADEAVGILSTGTSLGKDMSAVHRAIGYISGATPVRLLATTTNSVFALRSLNRDLMHFCTANTHDKSGPVSYVKDFLGDAKELIPDVWKGGERYQRYADAGGAQWTRSSISIEDSMLIHANELFRGEKSTTRTAWEKAMRFTSKPNDVMEIAIRIFMFEKLQKGPFKNDPRRAAYEVNKMLNFSRKGSLARYINSAVPFFNVGVQAMAAQARAAKTNPKLYARKLAQQWGLRLGMATAAYAYAGETMDDVSPRSKIGNIIIPLGLVPPAEDGSQNKRYPYMSIPVEKNPISALLDASLFAAIDIMRGRDKFGEWGDIVQLYYDNYEVDQFITAGIGPDILPPALSALMAAKKNRDPMTGDNIWRGNVAVNLAARGNLDTSPAAIAAGRVLGADPVGIERAVGAMTGGNMYVGFMGWLLHGVTPEEQESMSFAVTEAMPGLKSLVKWTRPATGIIQMVRADNASYQQLEVTNAVNYAMKEVRTGKMSIAEARSSFASNADWDSLTKKDAMLNLRNTLKGWKRYNTLVERYPEEVASLPPEKEFSIVSNADLKTRAEWWVENRPDTGTEEDRIFKQLSVAYFGNSNKFNYYRRRLLQGHTVR